jgi:hypothetical protein
MTESMRLGSTLSPTLTKRTVQGDTHLADQNETGMKTCRRFRVRVAGSPSSNQECT